jgi:DNA end-binding protein Ku
MMAARATASGTISFGLVAIPIKVYGASKSKSVRFSMLHTGDHSRLKQQYVCAKCDEIVPRSDTVKGFEYARGQYVVMTEDELKSLEKKTDRTIEIEEFIPIDQVDPIFFEKSNLIGPDKGGHKSYRLLCSAMIDAGKVALGRYGSRGRQQLVLLRPTMDGLTMHGLFYADEVRRFDDIDLGEVVEFKKGELDLAKQLIEQLSNEKFEPEKYADEYRQAVLLAVDRKVAGEEIVIVEEPDRRDQIIDLVAALKESLASKEPKVTKPKRVRKTAKAKASAADEKRTSAKKAAAK